MKRKIWLLVLILWIGLIFITSINKYIDIIEYFILFILIYLNIKNMNICGFKLLLNCLYISLFIAAVDETVDATRCKRKGNCQHEERCLTHELWCDLSDQIFEFLANISLGNLVEKQAVKDVARRQDEAVAIKGDSIGLKTPKMAQV